MSHYFLKCILNFLSTHWLSHPGAAGASGTAPYRWLCDNSKSVGLHKEQKVNLCQIPPLLVIIAALVLVVFGTRPWEAPKNNKQRWSRSALTGIGTAIVVVSGLVLMGLGQSTGNCLTSIQNLKVGYWGYIGLPVFVVVTVGNYVGYRQILWLRSLREKIVSPKE